MVIKYLKNRVKNVLITNVAISKIRHNDLEFYVKEGYGGKPINHFPPYHFFELYLSNENDKAIDKFKKWYREQFEKYYDAPKKKGGMENGSLYRLIEKKHNENNIYLDSTLSNLDKEIFEQSLEQRVFQRFELLESIQNNGFIQGKDKIEGIQKGEYVYLKGGHHRTAILSLLGHEEVPVLIINRFLLSLKNK